MAHREAPSAVTPGNAHLTAQTARNAVELLLIMQHYKTAQWQIMHWCNTGLCRKHMIQHSPARSNLVNMPFEYCTWRFQATHHSCKTAGYQLLCCHRHTGCNTSRHLNMWRANASHLFVCIKHYFVQKPSLEL